MKRYKVGVDVGGTFTDIIVADLDTQEIWRGKVLTTSEDQSLGTVAAFHEVEIPFADVSMFVHGHTVGINALLQRRGARVGLLCTQGTRDLLDGGQNVRPYGDSKYDPQWIRPHQARPIVHRRYIREVAERLLYNGEVHEPLDLDSARRALHFLRDGDIESIGICFINSYANPSHERRVQELACELMPNAFITTSDIHPVVGEYKRTTAVILNAYVGPQITTYLHRLKTRIEKDGFSGRVLIMQMNGGLRTLEKTVEHFPAYTIESGPVAGLLGAEFYSQEFLANPNLICIDIGGTSTDIGAVIEGHVQLTDDWEFEETLPLGAPSVDVRSIGAGGGSLIEVDSLGTIRVGPESAGSHPGPAAYGLGGEKPTVTDAYVAMGILKPSLFLGGRMELSAKLARQALTTVAEPTGVSDAELAWSSFQLVNVNIENEIRALAFDRAVDLRNFALFAYGGAGPIHAAFVARDLNMSEVIIPQHAGEFSALGMVVAPIKVEHSLSIVEPIDQVGVDKLADFFTGLEEKVFAELADQSVSPEDVTIDRFIYGMYGGQSSDNRVKLTDWPLGADALTRWQQDFHEYYQRIYGYSAPEMPIVVTTLAVQGQGPAGTMSVHSTPVRAPSADRDGDRTSLYLGTFYRDVPIVARGQLTLEHALRGPAIIDDEQATIVVPPDMTAEIDRYGAVHILTNPSPVKGA